MYGSTEGWVMLILIFIAAYLFWVAVVLGSYILNGIALYRLAKNNGLPWAGLAWVPVARTCLLGILCDRSQLALTGRSRGFTVILPLLEALAAGCGSLLTGALGFAVELRVYSGFPYSSAREAAGILLGLAFLAAQAVALCQLYRGYAPGRELLYAILSVIFGGLGRGILLMTVRNRVPCSASPGGTQPPPPPAGGPSFPGGSYRSGTGTTGWGPPPGHSSTTRREQPPSRGNGPES